MSGLSIIRYFPFARTKIVRQNVHHQDTSSACIFIEPDRRYNPLCHQCGCAGQTVHSKGHIRLIRDLNIANAEVFLQVNYRKVWCSKCGGIRVEQLTFADSCRRVTYRMAMYIHQLCKMLTVKDVAEHLHIDPKTVKDIDKSFLEQSFGRDNFDDLRVLMIDEIAVHKGYRYMTVVADFFSGRVVWMGNDRKKQTLDAFWQARNEPLKPWQWICGGRTSTASNTIARGPKSSLIFSTSCRALAGLLTRCDAANIQTPEVTAERLSRTAAIFCSKTRTT